jgi:hypothetical protein
LQNGFRIGESHHVDPSLNSVTGPAGIIRVEPKVMQVLVCLAAHAGHVVGKERLMQTVWPDTFVGDDVLTRSISELRPILEGDRPESDPDWAPDGQSLMFDRPPDYLAESSVPKAIHIFDLRTRELSTLPDSDGLFASRWSPSGRYVAAFTLDHTTLRLFDLSTRTWTELGRFKNLHNPAWSRDERFLYFEVADEASIYRVRLSDRAIERVVGLEGVWRSAYEGCTFEGLAPDDSPLISCFRNDTDIYALEWEMR